LFARAREAAGVATTESDASTLGELLTEARASYGDEFAAVLVSSRIWINGEVPTEGDATALADGDEVAVLPPVSGG
jgi:molybdopterin converting factor small subunit